VAEAAGVIPHVEGAAGVLEAKEAAGALVWGNKRKWYE